MTDQPTYYGEHAMTMPTVPDPAPVPAAPAQPWVSQPAAVTAPAQTPDPAPTTGAPQAQAASPEAASEPAPAVVPPVGSLARYARYDPYAGRDREQLVLVTGHDAAEDGTVRVRGAVIGFADDLASFLPGELTTG